MVRARQSRGHLLDVLVLAGGWADTGWMDRGVRVWQAGVQARQGNGMLLIGATFEILF